MTNVAVFHQSTNESRVCLGALREYDLLLRSLPNAHIHTYVDEVQYMESNLCILHAHYLTTTSVLVISSTINYYREPV